jgi:hypothetical protein
MILMSTKKPSQRQGVDVPDIWTVARLYVEDMFPLSQDKETILGYIRSRNIQAMAELVDRVSVQHADPSWIWINQLAALFKKNAAFTSDKCEETALKNFELGESLCRRTNRRIDFYSQYPERLPAQLNGYLDKMRTDIAVLLGSERTFVDDITSQLRITSGATEDRSRARSLPFLKMTGRLSAPFTSLKYLRVIMAELGCEFDDVKYVGCDVNRVEFVPKNWKTHRSIACEPTHVLPLQLAAGNYIANALKEWRIDLRDQSLNQEKARQGSIDGSFATIDLSMASDTLSINTVYDLLPEGWSQLLNDFRSKGGRLPDGGFVSYAKFSSMGNGFTFPLETLIFTAACRAVGSTEYTVYGDDIIVESGLVKDLLLLLKYLGFTVNDEKSFVDPDGRFRESCGSDWYNGKIVTPIYARCIPKTKADMCHFINSLVAVSQPYGKVIEYLSKLIIKNKLAIVPFNHDTMSGVFVDIHTAYQIGSLRKESEPNSDTVGWYQGLVFSGYGQKTAYRVSCQTRAYYTWFLKSGVENIDHGGKSTRIYGVTHPCLARLSGKVKGANPDISSTKVPKHTSYVHNRAISFVPVRNKAPSEYGALAQYLQSVNKLNRR